jgi:hypothetical protein
MKYKAFIVFILITSATCIVLSLDQLEIVESRFIRDKEYWNIECIVCSYSKKLVAKDLRELNEDLMIGYFYKLAYKLIKIDGEYISRDSKLMDL